MAVGTKRLTVVEHPLVQHKLSYLREVETPTVHFRKLANEDLSVAQARENQARDLENTARVLGKPRASAIRPPAMPRRMANTAIEDTTNTAATRLS